MFWYGGGWAFWQVALMWIGMVAFWGLLIWAIYALVTGALRKPPQGPAAGEDASGGARRILDERLARGEIDEDEYRRLREALSSGDGRGRAKAGSGR